jgi:hypothetical protein
MLACHAQDALPEGGFPSPGGRPLAVYRREVWRQGVDWSPVVALLQGVVRAALEVEVAAVLLPAGALAGVAGGVAVVVGRSVAERHAGSDSSS